MIRAIALLILLSACSDKPPVFVGEKAKQINMSAAAQDASLPTELFDEIMGVYRPLIFDQTNADREAESKAKLEIPTDFFSFNVFLTERTKGVLGGSNYDLLFGKGGGELDLKDFVRNDKGTFYLGIKPVIPGLEKEDFNIFFLSNSIKWNSEGENYGSGCDVYLDISDFFNQAMKQDGFVVNVKGQRHVGLLAGSYFMAVSIKGRLFLSQLTIKDSRYRKLHCR